MMPAAKNLIAPFYFLLWMGLLLPACACADQLEIIPLQHRSVEEVLPLIRPLLDQDDVASGMNYQLILRTSPRNLEQIKQLLQSIDIAPRRLKITVMQDVDSATVARLTALSGNIGVGKNVRIIVPGSRDNSGLSVEAGQGQDKLKARVREDISLEDDKKTQQIQVLEGNRALIHSGQSIAVPQRQVIQQPSGVHVIDSFQYQDVSSGFYVLPRVNGDNVTLEITAQNDSLPFDTRGVPAPHIQQASTTVAGRLGTWIVVGGLSQQKNDDDASIFARHVSQQHEQRNVLIKVEQLE